MTSRLPRRTIDAALEAAEGLWLPETLSQGAEHGRADRRVAGRWEQGYALIKRSLEIALENDLTSAALRAYNNLGDMLDRRDRYEEAIEVQAAGIALARKVGARANEWRLLGEMAFMLLWLGRYDEARAAFEHIPEHGLELGASLRRCRSAWPRSRATSPRRAASTTRATSGKAKTPTSRTGSAT